MYIAISARRDLFCARRLTKTEDYFRFTEALRGARAERAPSNLIISRAKDKIRRIRAEIAEQHESMMELISECGLRFKVMPTDIYTALTDSASLPLEDRPDARRAVREGMLRLLAPTEGDQLLREAEVLIGGSRPGGRVFPLQGVQLVTERTLQRGLPR